MHDHADRAADELEKELIRLQRLLEDVKYERAFTGKQEGLHLYVSELTRLDQEIQKYETGIVEVTSLIAQRQ